MRNIYKVGRQRLTLRGEAFRLLGRGEAPGLADLSREHDHLRVEASEMLDVPRIREWLSFLRRQPERTRPGDRDHGEGTFPHRG